MIFMLERCVMLTILVHGLLLEVLQLQLYHLNVMEILLTQEEQLEITLIVLIILLHQLLYAQLQQANL